MKAKEIIKKFENNKSLPIKKYLTLYAVLFFTITIVLAVIFMHMDIQEETLSHSDIVIFMGTLYGSHFATIRLFHNKNKRLFTPEEYNKYTRGADIILFFYMIMQIIILIIRLIPERQMFFTEINDINASSFIMMPLFFLFIMGLSLLIQRKIIKSTIKMVYKHHIKST